jgi:putative ABC transport system ATP-binding protein
LIAEHVVVVRGGRRIVDGASIEVCPGRVVSVQGASGSGKSTFLRALAWLIPVDEGRVLFEGKTPRAFGVLAYRRHVAYVPQLPRMFDGSVADNLRAGPRFRGAVLSDPAVTDLLERVGLSPTLAGRPAGDLSGGERLRVALARALANEPEVLLVDEPTSALDPAAAETVIASVIALAKRGAAVLVVTHVEEHARALGGERYRMEAGALRREDAP